MTTFTSHIWLYPLVGFEPSQSSRTESHLFPFSRSYRRKRKEKQPRCSLNRLTTRSTTYLISTSTWSPPTWMATKTFHSLAATWISSSHWIRCRVTVAISRPLGLLPSVLVGPLSPGVKTSGVCRRIPRPHHRASKEAFPRKTLSSPLLCPT